MKTRKTEVLYGEFDVLFPVPSSIEEAEGPTCFNETGSVLDSAINDTIARHTLPRYYRDLAKDLEASGEKRNVVGTKAGKKNEDGTPGVEVPILEQDRQFIKRVYEAKDDDARKAFISAAQDKASSFSFYEVREAGAPSSRISEAALEKANEFIAAAEADVKAAKIETLTGYKAARDADGSVTPEGMARAIMALQTFHKEKLKREMAEALA